MYIITDHNPVFANKTACEHATRWVRPTAAVAETLIRLRAGRIKRAHVFASELETALYKGDNDIRDHYAGLLAVCVLPLVTGDKVHICPTALHHVPSDVECIVREPDEDGYVRVLVPSHYRDQNKMERVLLFRPQELH